LAKIKKTIVPGTSSKAKWMVAVRYGIYAMLFIVMLRGIITFFVPNSVVNQALETPVTVNEAAQSFAEAFAQNYFSFDVGKEDEYRKRLEPFVAKGLLADDMGVKLTAIRVGYEVKNTRTWHTAKVTDQTADIDVRLEIEKIEENATGKNEVMYRYLRVPIAFNGTSYFVNDYPTVLPEPLIPVGEMASYPELSETSNEVKVNVQLALEDFLKAYSIDPPTKLRYFMLDGKEISGYNGKMTFDRTQSIRTFLPAAAADQTTIVNQVIAYVTVLWQDENQVELKQNLTVELEFKDDRWYIKTFQGGFKS